MHVPQDVVVRQIRRITKQPFDFWLLNLEHDYRNLPRFFEAVRVPNGAELFTNECVFPGRELDEALKEGNWNLLDEKELRAEERRLLIESAKSLQGMKSIISAPKELRNAITMTKKTGVRLWLGTHYLDYPTERWRPRLHNAYLLIEDGAISYVHRKRFLWPTEEGISDVIGREGTNAVTTPKYDGIFENRAFLICQEAPRFYSPKWGKSPTHIPEIREAKPDFVVIPAHWIGEDGDSPAARADKERMLRQIGLAISRTVKDPIDRFSAVRREGCLTLVVNAYHAYVCGPVDEKSVKARVYAEQPHRGWLRVTNDGITRGTF